MISTLNQRSNFHNSCEDSIYVGHSYDVIYGVIADGCSTGTKSHFASQLIAYSVESNARFNTLLSDSFVKSILFDLRSSAKVLNLTDSNLLSTCLLFAYYPHLKRLQLRLFGDGVYYINDIEYRIDQNNEPDYLGYLINKDYSDIDKYLLKYPIIEYTDVHKFIICSDGIDRIERTVLQEPAKVDPLKLLLHPPTSANYLTRMWNLIKRDGFTLSDDLSIISYAGS